MLANATLHTEKYYGSDVKVAYGLTQRLLHHESKQQGFNLTATQDVHFTEVPNKHLVFLMPRRFSLFNQVGSNELDDVTGEGGL